MHSPLYIPGVKKENPYISIYIYFYDSACSLSLSPDPKGGQDVHETATAGSKSNFSKIDRSAAVAFWDA
jgi:hypothetical protein